MPLDRAQIAALIPHAGAMCLLAEVASWDAASIECTATSHNDAGNPLRSGAMLSAWCGIEYAAQAMAVHGALGAAGAGRPRAGYLVGLRDVVCARERLDDLPGPLAITATRVMGDAHNVIYEFRVRAGALEVLSGRATVVLSVERAAA